jgi:hypothetical protein
VLRELAKQFLALAESQGATAPLMVGHSNMGVACASAGKFLRARAHHDQALVLYDPTVHRALLTHFAGQDQRVVDLSFRSLTMWMLGYPDAALADAERALQEARAINHVPKVRSRGPPVPHALGRTRTTMRGSLASSSSALRITSTALPVSVSNGDAHRERTAGRRTGRADRARRVYGLS